jgi:rod shape determining protein RodA
MARNNLWRHFDFTLLGIVALLVIIGIAMVRSATLSSPDTGIEEFSRQSLFALVGIPVIIAASAIDYRVWGGLSGSLYVLLLVLLAFVQVFGEAVFGASRWIPLSGLGIPINIQPSELGKFIMVLVLGYYLANNGAQIHRLGFVLRTLIYIGVPVIFIALQPDFSSCILYGVIWFSLLWASGLRWQHVLVLAGITALIGALGFFLALQSESALYIVQRIVNFILPNQDSQQYRDATYNITQSLISIGSGGWFGEGYGNGSQVQLRFLKVRHTDFIFAAIANEFGFVGSVVIVLLFVALVVRIFRAAQMARDAYGRLICFGVGAVILFEAFSNIASNMNLLPVTGSPLPFISYGGSSLWTFLFAIGLVESVVLRHKQIEF